MMHIPSFNSELRTLELKVDIAVRRDGSIKEDGVLYRCSGCDSVRQARTQKEDYNSKSCYVCLHAIWRGGFHRITGTKVHLWLYCHDILCTHLTQPFQFMHRCEHELMRKRL